jgi:undecaprenyl-diphosphatase
MEKSILIAVLVGVLQGVFEWLPISSEGNIALVLSWMGSSPDRAVAFALFLHLGTALSATVYYRGELRDLITLGSRWRPKRAFEEDTVVVTFLGVATVVSGVVGLAAYAVLEQVVSALTGGAIVVLIGVLLVGTGIFQRLSTPVTSEGTEHPTTVDAVLVGVAQGLAILPGVSRSGMTTGTLLLRGYDGPAAFRFSFILSIPAAIGGGLLAYLGTGLATVTPRAAGIALLAAFLVGYATIDVLLRIVHRVAFWGVCVGLGSLAVVGGLLVI